MALAVPSRRALLTPRFYPSLDFNFVTGSTTLDSTITFTRASSAYRVNASGLLESVTTDVARFDYDPATLAPRGLLIEEARTNSFLRSVEFDNAAWSLQNATISANSTVAPDGTTTGDTITATGGSASAYQNITLTAASWTLSCFFKRGGGNPSDWVFFDVAGGVNLQAYFNVATGAVGTVDAGVTAAIENYGNGWYRCTMTFTGIASGTNVLIGVALSDNNQGTSGAQTTIIWGCQIELGSFATSAILTTSATVTRAADVATMEIGSWFNADESTVLAEAATKDGASTTGNGLVFIDDGTNNNSFRLNIFINVVGSGSNGRAVSRVAASNVGDVNAGSAVVANVATKIVGGFQANNFAVAKDGTLGALDTAGAMPSGLTRMVFGSNVATGLSYLNGWLRRVTYFPRRLPNTLLQTMSR